jgi:flagellar hook-associated protein 2
MTVSLSTAGTHNTGTLTSTGLGSGLDINTMVTAIVNATIQPQQNRLQAYQTADQSTISALGVLKSVLSSLQTAADSITTGGALSQLSASVSDSSVFTASAGTGAVAGSYQVQIQTLAKANVIKSTAYASADAAVSDGTYTLSAGGKTFSVTVGAGSDTLSGLADAINNASDNSGVSATVVNASNGSYLLLSATQSGVANAVSMSASPGGMSFTSVQDAADATGTIAGLPFDSASNVVSGVLKGVTLSLASASPNTTQTLNVSANTKAAATAVQSFVSAYNTAISLITADTKYTPGSGSGASATSGTAGPLQGDVSIQSLQQQLQAIIGGGVSGGTFTSLSQLGLSFNDDGTIAVDNTKLNTALQQNGAAVQSLFSGSQGLGTRLDTLLGNYAGASGVIDNKTSVLNDQVGTITSQLNDLTARQTQLTAQYYAQFNAMDSVVAGYKSTSSLLTQLYAPRTQNSNGSSGG